MSFNQSAPRINGIDHVHLYVSDREKAVSWYRKVLGFEVFEPLSLWASETGPLTVTDPDNTVHMALFKRNDQAPSSSIAFKTDAEGFQAWLQRLEALGVKVRIADHQVTESLYFSDPDGNLHEITYYKEALAQ